MYAELVAWMESHRLHTEDVAILVDRFCPVKWLVEDANRNGLAAQAGILIVVWGDEPRVKENLSRYFGLKNSRV